MATNEMRSVYVIKSAGGICKVGISFDPESRLRGLLTGHGIGLELVHIEVTDNESAMLIERAAHKMMEKTRTAGEWFRVPAEKAIQAVQIAAWIVADCKKHIIAPSRLRTPIPVGDAKQAQAHHGLGPTGEDADIIERVWQSLPAGRVCHAQIMDALSLERDGIGIHRKTVSAWLNAHGIFRLGERTPYNGKRATWFFKKGTPKLVAKAE